MKKKLVCAALLSGLVMGSAQADSSGHWAAGLGISTLGVNGNVAYKFNESFKLRGVLNFFQMTRKFNGDVNVNAQLRLLTAGLMGDWHFLQNGFRLTGGLLYNGNRFKAKATVAQNFTVNGRTYTPAQMGEAHGTLDFRKISPYIGIGYDSGHEQKRGFAFNADVGILFQGNVRGKINSLTGLLQNNAQAINDMKDEFVQNVNKSSWLKTYPVVSLGVSYKF